MFIITLKEIIGFIVAGLIVLIVLIAKIFDYYEKRRKNK
mgnify:CR=1 FL=1